MVDSRVAGRGAIRRRRECLICSQRFTTFERVEQSALLVVKRDGSRQPFDRAKLLAGLTRACVKRPVSMDQIEHAAVTIEANLRNGVRDEVEADPKRLVALELDGSVQAYAIYRLLHSFEDGASTGRLEVSEVIGSSPQATAAIWRFVLDIDWYATLECSLLPVDHALFTLLATPAHPLSNYRLALDAARRRWRGALRARVCKRRLNRHRCA